MSTTGAIPVPFASKLTLQIRGQLVVVRLERVHHRRLAVGVAQTQIAAGRHQHVADAAVLGAGRLVQRRLAAVRMRKQC